MQSLSSIVKQRGKATGSASSKDADTPFFKPIVQPKLTINQPNDVYEQEADAVADKVMKMTGNDTVQTKFFNPSISFIQRVCAHCEEEKKEMQRKEMNGDKTNDNSDLESYVNNLNSSGQSLPAEVRDFYSPRMGFDFSNVKVHTDSIAAKSAQSINALAYTTGNNIVFNSGQYSPSTDRGKRLLGHELTHVVQQHNNVQSKKIQRAAYVCDEYSTSYRSTYNPGPGINLTLSGNAFTINANMEVYGPGATAAIASQMQSTISRVWNASFSTGYSVTANISITVRGATADSSRTGIYVIPDNGMTRVMPRYWLVGSDEVRYYIGSPDSNINWTPAHEFGHLIGLPDHYSESIGSRITGLFGGTRTGTTVDPGWQGNLMGSHGGVLESKNLEELKNRRFATYTCTSGHLESPL